MAITTNAELLTAIDNYIDDSLTDRRAEFISLAEAKINRQFRGLQQQKLTFATYDTSATDRSIALPAGYLEMIDMAIKVSTDADTEYDELKYTPPERLKKYYSSSGQPEWFTVRNQIEFERVADQTYTLRMDYLKMWDIATDSTNWLLTNFPDVYLYGALMEASVFVVEDQRVPMWKSMFEQAISELNDLAERTNDDAELSVSELAAMSYGNSRYDINKDSW